MPHHRGLVGQLGVVGKRLAPALSSLTIRSPFRGVVSYATMYLNVLHGKGAGAGWDLLNEVARRFIHRTDPVLFDVGAHTGEWSRAMRRAFEKSWIIQFEPVPKSADQLREANGTNVELIEAAVSSEPGTATLHVSEDAPDTSSLSARRESIFSEHEYQRLRVDVVTIDDVVKERNISSIDFLKLDIEGNELAALQGAMRSLQNGIIRSLSFEFGSGNINTRTFFHDFWDLLIPLGFKIYRICPGGGLLSILQYYEDIEYFRNVTNYVASQE